MVTRNLWRRALGLASSSRVSVLGLVVVAALGCGDNRGQGFAPEPDAGPRTDLGLPDGTTCRDDQTQCGASCVDTLSDRDNCGDCGQRCPDAQMCVQGVCQNECPQGQLRCDNVCVNLNTSQTHCGSCGRACPTGLVCTLGRCEVECGPQYARCERTLPDGGVADGGASGTPYFCADTRNDQRNCGGCGMACPAGRVCEAGMCVAYCPPGQERCGGQCVTLASSRDHCGACGTACTASQRCMSGTCVETGCPQGTMLCMGRCIDIQSDSANCGACGTVCPSPQFCVAGQLRPAVRGRPHGVFGPLRRPADRPRTTAACLRQRVRRGPGVHQRPVRAVLRDGHDGVQRAAAITTSTDRGNCGMCGRACGAGELCAGGACVAACAPSQTLCDGRCVNLQVDPGHCGVCGLSCGTGFACVAGVCRPGMGTTVPACAAPSLQCGTRCVDPRNDNAHCGMCGMACAADRLCDNGTCVAPCAAGQDRCGGACVDVRSNVANCGRCGNACAMGLSCVNGACVMEDTFRIQALDAMGCVSLDHNDLTGDDRGPLAVSANRVFVTGDGPSFNAATVRFNADDVRMGGTALPAAYDLMASNITTGTAYVLLNAMGQSPISTFSGQMITQLAPLNDDGTLGTARIMLSPPLALGSTVGLFSGPSRIVVHNGTRWFQIRLPSGAVEPVGPTTATAPPRGSCESSYWGGVAEFFDSQLHVVYVTNSTTISRYRISDARITPVASFMSLSDACSLGVARSRNRWYFHHEGSSQFSSGDESLVSCPAQFGQ
jgi:hypothetical protein